MKLFLILEHRGYQPLYIRTEELCMFDTETHKIKILTKVSSGLIDWLAKYKIKHVLNIFDDDDNWNSYNEYERDTFRSKGMSYSSNMLNVQFFSSWLKNSLSLDNTFIQYKGQSNYDLYEDYIAKYLKASYDYDLSYINIARKVDQTMLRNM